MTYKDNVVEAILELKDRTGSSSIAIKKLMQTKLGKDKKWSNYNFLTALKNGVAAGEFVQVKNSYKLSPDFKKSLTSKSKKSAAAPKKTATKKTTKKKSAPKKKATTKKSAPKKKTTTKKAAPKKKTATKKTAPKKKAAPKKKSVPKKKATTKATKK
eukprot:CAMPEP_0194237408 /NCGR_PEP_ID=MMETSP0158-20130606/4429_1 /TAXON_ID=33649 /ORGANISM="Thalassionema nitzschioides, Strain L26-B" /LENGTH=156 /DNA_ID=CAMNT_0038971435 /DNA_START=27 /DNA_END=497 /DNA_ORIENTATION=-